MEKELDEVFGGGRLLRVPAPTVLPSGYSRYGVRAFTTAKGACPDVSSCAALGLAPLLPRHCYSYGLADPFSSVSLRAWLGLAVSWKNVRFPTHFLFCRLIRSLPSGTNRIDLCFNGGFSNSHFIDFVLRFLWFAVLARYSTLQHTLTRTGS